MTNTCTKLNLLILQKIMLIQNPDPYLKQDKSSESAIQVKNATLSWTKPESQLDQVQGSSKNKVEEIQNSQTPETLQTLRNISFTLPKVSPAFNMVLNCLSNQTFIVFYVLKGKLLGVCGNVGSGKTSLISSILEQVVLPLREFLTHDLLLFFLLSNFPLEFK